MGSVCLQSVLSRVFQIIFFGFQNWGGLVLLLVVAFMEYSLLCVVWMLYVVSGAQFKVGGVCRKSYGFCFRF